MKRKLTALLLALLMTASSLTLLSCGENEVNSDTNAPISTDTSADATSNDVTEESDALDARASVSDDLPNVTYNGADFNFLVNTTSADFSYTNEILAEALNGDACNDAIYNRNGLISERFDININCDEQTDSHSVIVTLETAGTNIYHVVSMKNHCGQTPIKANMLMNWQEAPYVNLDKPWHIKMANDDATINDRLYLIHSDLSVSAMVYTHAIYCNTNLAGKFGYTADDFYGLVKEGKWTFDKMSEIVAGMYVDGNGNGEKDLEGDTYGFGYAVVNPADVWLTAFGEKSFEVNADNTVDLTYGSEKVASIVEKLVDFHYNNIGYYKITSQYGEETYFARDMLVMAPMRFYSSYNALRDMESTYIMIPYPKWDEAQEQYLTNADDKFSVFGVPISMYDQFEYVSVIFEAMCAESWKSVYPAYYDMALKGKYSSDATTAEMVDLIMAGRAFDFGSQINLGYYFDTRNLINDQNTNVASFFRQTSKVRAKTIEAVLKDNYGVE